MAITTVFNQGMKVAVETDRGTAPSGEKLGKAWWEGGRWVSVLTDGFPSIQDNAATIFPQSFAGDRRVNQQPPVEGRKWSEGDFSAPAVYDLLGLLLYAAMGTVSSNQVPSFSAPSLLLAAEPLGQGQKLMNLNNQPTNGGNIIRFEIKGSSAGAVGTITVSGIDSYGNGASEVISFASEGTVYTRTSFSFIGNSGTSVALTKAGTGGTIQALGIQHFVHTFTTAQSNPTLAFERIGNPTAGEASANKAFMHVGMVLRELGLTTDAEAVDGIFMLNAGFEGEPTGLSTATSIHNPSPLRIWPSWGLRVRRDNGTTWDVVKTISLNINTGNRNYRAAAGAQGPQGSFFGPNENTGNISIYVNNELEYKKWQQASQIRMHALWSSPWQMGASKMQLSASIPAYFESPQVNDEDSAFVFAGDYRIVRDDNFPFSFQLTSPLPGKALGNSVD